MSLALDGRSTTPIAPPALIVAVPRSGATLLAYLLDSQPRIECRGDMRLAGMVTGMDSILRSGSQNEAWPRSRRAEIAETLLDGVFEDVQSRRVILSSDAIDHCQLVAETFESSPLICIYRNCLDTVASLLEMLYLGRSFLGTHRVVLRAHAERHASNLVHGLALYWCDRTERLLELEKQHDTRSCRVLYERLVVAPNEVGDGVSRMLGLGWDLPSASRERVFTEERRQRLVGDPKIWFKDDFDAASVGRGLSLPLEMIGPVVMRRIDALSRELAYPSVESLAGFSGTGVSIGELRPGLNVTLPGRSGTTTAERSDVIRIAMRHHAERTELASKLERIFHNVAVRLRGDRALSSRLTTAATARIAIVDLGDSWILDFQNRRVRRGIGDSDCILRVQAQTLVDLLEHRTGAVEAMHRGQLSVTAAFRENPARMPAHQLLSQLETLIEVCRYPTSAPDDVISIDSALT